MLINFEERNVKSKINKTKPINCLNVKEICEREEPTASAGGTTREAGSGIRGEESGEEESLLEKDCCWVSKKEK